MPRLKRSLGQVFLKDSWPVEKVVSRADGWRATRVLEIGPGGGVLTRGLLDKGFKVFAVEKDDRFAEKLQDFKRTWQPKGQAEFEVTNEDILKFDFPRWLQNSGEPTAVVGNIPYNISSSILLMLLPHIEKLQGVCLMVQLEFAQRLAALSGSKNYGSLSVFAQLRARVSLDCKVDRSCFVPIPKVDSALVSLNSPKEKYSDKDLKHAEQVCRLAFQQRRKKLSNALSTLLEKVEVNKSPIDLNRRPETLRPEEYLELGRFFFAAD